MGAGVCCVQKRLDAAYDSIDEQTGNCYSVQHGAFGRDAAGAAGRAGTPWPMVASRSLPGSGASCGASCGMEGDSLSLFYEVRRPEPDEPRRNDLAVHRKTGVTHVLETTQKPRKSASQEKLSSFIRSLRQLGTGSDGIAKVFDVFEDYLHIRLLLEHCTGGSVYERILGRSYFTEQESAMLVKHMLQALATLHENHLDHGTLVPDSFHFLDNSPHAALKLTEFGLQAKILRWDAAERLQAVHETQTSSERWCGAHFCETCRLVFCAPEVAPPHQPNRRWREGGSGAAAAPAAVNARPDLHEELSGPDLLDSELLAWVIDEHADWLEEQPQDLAREHRRKLQAADIWSVGGIAFLLLCGYPPFFAPSRNVILARLHRGDMAFDPPFWSKISEEAKSFVSSCLQLSCWDRPSAVEALEHPWIRNLAESSPSGSMFPSFMLNLRRFYRTSLIETYVGDMLARQFCREDEHHFLAFCRSLDPTSSGFFTVSDLKKVLGAMGHEEIGELVTGCFMRALRHPGESYVDYLAMLDSIHFRRQHLFEDELWHHFQRFCQSGGFYGGKTSGRMPVAQISSLLDDHSIISLLMREVAQHGVKEDAVRQSVQIGLKSRQLGADVEFRSLAVLLLKVVPYCNPAEARVAPDDNEFDAVE